MKLFFTKTLHRIIAAALLLCSTFPAAAQYTLQFVKANSQYVTVPHSSSLNFTNTFTIEALVNYNGSDVTIVDKGNYDHLFQISQGTFPGKLAYYNKAGWIYSTGTVPENTLTHVAMTFSSGTVTFYINGVASGTGTSTMSQDDQPLNIGRQQPTDCQCNFFNGTMDELRIWNTARTQTEIQANKDGAVNAGSAGLVAYYKFNEGSGTTTADATSYGNNGTLVNGPTFVYRTEPSSSKPFVQLGNKVTGTGLDGAAGQGESVDVSADGNSAIVGGIGDDGGRGAVWFYKKNGSNWQLDGPKIAVESFGFGTSVSISADGTTAVIGAPGDNGGIGAAWIFVRTGGAWLQQGAKLVGTGAVGTANQGQSVSISDDGNRVIVGAHKDNTNGSAWIFERTGTVWAQYNSKLTIKPAGALAAEVGYSVAISGDGHTVMVGGRFDAGGIGASWIFKDDGTNGAWSMKAKLVGSGAIGSGLQGSTVSLSYDGTTAATGARGDDNGIGAVWGFTLNGTTWAQYGEKTIIPGGEQIQLGWSVALSGDGNTLLAGAPLQPSGETVPGAAYTFHKNADFHIGWDLPKSVIVGTGSTGVLSSQGYAVSLSADGNTAVIGGPDDDVNIGATWAFARSGNDWTQQGQKLVGPGVISPTQQGQSVAISADGNTAVVGGPYYDRNKGAIWVYTRSGSAWVQLQQLSVTPFNRSSLGASVAISADGNTIFAGGYSDNKGKGAVWVFTRSGGVFSEQAKLVAGNAGDTGYQGTSVACSANGNTVIFGAPGDNSGTGAAFVYNRADGTWSQKAKLLGSNSFNEGQEMGIAVSISADGNTAIAGAKSARNSSFADLPTGAAYVFILSGNSWVQQTRITGPTTAVLFGSATSISGDGNTAAIGAPDHNQMQGGTWIFVRSEGNWSQQTILLPTGKTGESKTGSSLALTSSGDRLLIGGPQDNSGAGATWVFDRSGTTWQQKGRLYGTGAVGNANQGTSVAISSRGDFSITGGIGDNREYGAAWTYATQENCDQSPTRLYVKSSANGADNGNNWDNAFNTLQDALTAARTCSNITQIWVAKGTYYPDEGIGYTNNDRFASFKMINNVAIYGGFAGNEAADYDLANRNFLTNETILSGDIDKNDQPNFVNTSGNSNHLFFNINSGLTITAILNGFTITAGNATNDSGGGFFNSGGSPTIASCRIIENQAQYGGGLYNSNSSPKISINNCYIANNVSTSYGGGLYNASTGVMEIANTQIMGNAATASFGGGIANIGGLLVSGSRVNDNNADNGGGIQQTGGSLTVFNSEINNNRTVYQGSAINIQDCSNATLTNCSITSNASQSSIGGIANGAFGANALVNLINCTVANNTSVGIYKAIYTSVNGTGLTAATIVKNTVIANNPGGNFLQHNGALLQSGGNNIDSDGSSGLTNGANGDLVNVDPLFVSATSFSLQTCSPAVNSGSDAANATVTDIAGNTRKFGTIDIGAYELQQAKANPSLPVSGLEIEQTILANHTLSFAESCVLLAKLKSSGTSPVAGSVESRVWLEATQPIHNSQPYVRRHYQIAPDAGAATATGTVTLYFTKADFSTFNDYPGVVSLLPIGPDDDDGISHFAIYKYSDKSSDQTGLPGSYPQPGIMLSAPEVQLTWNAASQWWEATFEVKGFSGFFAGSTGNNPLPISDLLDFTVNKNSENGAAIKWQVIPDHQIERFEVEKSYDGRSFTTLQRVPASTGVTSYIVNDGQLQIGQQYYRLKLFDTDGSISHSRIRSLQWDAIQLAEAYPNPFGNTLKLSFSAVVAGDLEVSLINILGQTLGKQTFSLSAGPNKLSMKTGNLADGVYLVRYTMSGTSGFLRVVKK